MPDILEIQQFSLWEKLERQGVPLAFDLEITARCNMGCRHCYISLPATDRTARARELTPDEILRIAGEAVHLGALWCLITGGEPLLRDDFPEIYLGLKRLGLLMSVFTNATLVDGEHAALFKKYPPRDIEVTVYGATSETYERVTRRPGSFAAFVRGMDQLLASGVKIRLKAMALRSNLHEMAEIARFCRQYTKDYFRFDPVLHLRFDRDPARNAEIVAERLTPEQIVALERADEERFAAMERGCDRLIQFDPERPSYDECRACKERQGCRRFTFFSRLIRCGAGLGSFSVGYDGTFRLCSSLWAPGTTCDLRRGTLREACETLVPHVRSMRTANEALLQCCGSCPYDNLCLCCPAHAHLETGDPEAVVPYFCQVARARAAMLTGRNRTGPPPACGGRLFLAPE